LPELPEVEYVRRMLRPAMQGARFERVHLRRPNLRYAFGDDFVERLEGRTVSALVRRAKYLIAELTSGDALVMHLGMSGWFRVLRAGRVGARPRLYYEPSRLGAHDHVVFEMSSGAVIVFNDPRRFGFMKIVPDGGRERDPTLTALGPEPLERSFTGGVLARALAGRSRSSIKAALLDQRVVAGLGNIYACEALHRARLSPLRRASTLVTSSGRPRPALLALAASVQETLRSAIAGRHRAGASDRFLVYDREGRRCPRRGCGGLIRRIVQSGRSTFYCPACQR
jgi:formamidopyrimidine-DNA glycosylase